MHALVLLRDEFRSRHRTKPPLTNQVDVLLGHSLTHSLIAQMLPTHSLFRSHSIQAITQ